MNFSMDSAWSSEFNTRGLKDGSALLLASWISDLPGQRQYVGMGGGNIQELNSTWSPADWTATPGTHLLRNPHHLTAGDSHGGWPLCPCLSVTSLVLASKILYSGKPTSLGKTGVLGDRGQYLRFSNSICSPWQFWFGSCHQKHEQF